MDALSDYKYLCTNIKNAGNVIAFPAFFHIFAFEERKLSLQDILEFEEALCLFPYTEIQLVAYAVLKGCSCVIHIRTHKNKHFNWFVVNFSLLS